MLGNPLIVNSFKKAIRIEDPIIVFLMETKSNVDWMNVVCNQCGFKNCFIVPNLGLNGGLALFWKNEVIVEVKKSALSHIDAVLVGGDSFRPWHLIGFYGNPDTSWRITSWNLLKDLSLASQLLCMVVGDFNEIRSSLEKEGGVPRPKYRMPRFNNAINFCGLREVGFVGPTFTWLYQKRDGTQIHERLDKALVSQDWLSLFLSLKLYHKSSSVSDHSSLLLNFLPKPKKGKQKKLFKFESMWMGDARCEQVVVATWNEGLLSSSDFPVVRCLDECRKRLEV